MIIQYLLCFITGVLIGLICYHYAGFNDDRVKILLMKLYQKDMEIAMLNNMLNERLRK